MYTQSESYYRELVHTNMGAGQPKPGAWPSRPATQEQAKGHLLQALFLLRETGRVCVFASAVDRGDEPHPHDGGQLAALEVH